MTSQATIRHTTISTDRTTLGATVFTPAMPIKAAVMIAPATGIKRQFYQNFAEFLANQGYGVITFDNEGIGESLVGKLSDSSASLVTWGRHDMTAVLDTLTHTFVDTKYHLIGHSAGGQLFGLMPNHDKLSSVFNVGCSSGRIRNMAMPYRAKAMFFMDIFIPMSNRLFGFAKTSKVGMGENLPKNVARQWAEWCNGQGYIKTAFGKEVKEHYYDDVKLPSLWLNAPDDDIANDANVAEMIAVFPHITATTKTLNPADYGLQEIGHMKFFSRKSAVLWGMATDWLDKHG